jgi:hypothetical protein
MTTPSDIDENRKALFGWMILNKLGNDAVHHVEREPSKLPLWKERGYQCIPVYVTLKDAFAVGMTYKI